MSERTIGAAAFKATVLAELDHVAATGETLIVTKRGKPVAKVTPVDPPVDLRGTVTYLVSAEELIAPLHEDWDPQLP